MIFASGTSLGNFWLGMTVLGLAWNFSFTSSTVMLTSQYREGEAERVQGINDFIIFFCAGLAAFSAGYFYGELGRWRRRWPTLTTTSQLADDFGWTAVLLLTTVGELVLAVLIGAAWTKRDEADKGRLSAAEEATSERL